MPWLLCSLEPSAAPVSAVAVYPVGAALLSLIHIANVCAAHDATCMKSGPAMHSPFMFEAVPRALL